MFKARYVFSGRDAATDAVMPSVLIHHARRSLTQLHSQSRPDPARAYLALGISRRPDML